MKNPIFSVTCLLLLLAFAIPAESLRAQVSAQQRFYDEITAREDFIKGLAAYELGNYDDALLLLNKAYVKIPGESALSFALSETYLKKEDLVKAALYAKEAVERDPSNKWYRLKLAEIYGLTGQNDATLKVLKELIDLNPNDMNALSALSSAQTRQKKFIDANRTLDRIMRIGGESWIIYYEKFQNFSAMGLRDSSITMLRKMQELEPENLVTLQILSQFYSEGNDTENAKSVLIDALNVNARDPETLLLLADVYISEAKWDSAGTLVASFVGDTLINPNEKLPFVDHLLKVYRQDPTNVALGTVMTDIVDAYVNAHPTYAPAHAYAAELYIELDDNDKALVALDRTVELMPSNEQAWQERIRLLLQANRLTEAIEVGNEADIMVPDNPFILYLVGNAYYMNKQTNEAIEWLARAVDLPARNDFKSVVYTSLGDAHNSKRDFVEADQAFEESLRLNPANDVTLNNYAYSLSNRDNAEALSKAKDMADRALQAAPDNASYLDTAGWIYYRLGNYSKARDLVKKSLDINSDSAEVLEHMGDILEKLGDKKGAQQYWRRALEIEPNRTHLSDRVE